MSKKEEIILKVYEILEDLTIEQGNKEKTKAMRIIDLLERELKNY